jgi:hypothetical protein
MNVSSKSISVDAVRAAVISEMVGRGSRDVLLTPDISEAQLIKDFILLVCVAFGDDVGKARMSCLALFLSCETNASDGFVGPGISILSAKKGGFDDLLKAYAEKMVNTVRTKQGLIGDDWKVVCIFVYIFAE